MCKAIREFMADMANAEPEMAAIVAMGMAPSTDEVNTAISEFYEWYEAVSERWSAELAKKAGTS